MFGGLPDEFTVAGKTGTAENETQSITRGTSGMRRRRLRESSWRWSSSRGRGANAAAPAVCQTMAAYLAFDAGDCGGGASAN